MGITEPDRMSVVRGLPEEGRADPVHGRAGRPGMDAPGRHAGDPAER